ncbi:MarR family winged helix-turn-helix transcriptional regulator [Chloroflexota bacterium]
MIDATVERNFALYVLLYQARDAMAKVAGRETEKYGISLMQMAALYVVKNAAGPTTPAEIARWLFREPNGVSGMLERMEKKGFVTRTKDLDRKNLIRVAMTEEGEEVYRRVTELGAMARLLSNLSKEELNNFRIYLEKLRDRGLEDLGTEYGLRFAGDSGPYLLRDRPMPLALLRQARDAMARVFENEARRYGVSFMQASVLIVVKSIKGPATPAEIARWLFREPHGVSGLLERLEKKGLVKRTKDLDRRNLIRVVLTEEGETIYRQVGEMEALSGIFSCLSQEELNNFEIYLWKLRDKAVEELGITNKLPFPEKPTWSQQQERRSGFTNKIVDAFFGRFSRQ